MASAGMDRVAGGDYLPGLAMVGLFVAGNLPGGGGADNVAARLVDAAGNLRVSNTVARQLAGPRSFIPSLAILETVRGGARVADPQGAAGHFMYRIGAQNGTLEVLVDEANSVINHVLYRSH